MSARPLTRQSTYARFLQKLDHVQCLFDVWYFIFEALSALCQICVHVTIFPILLSVQECHARTRHYNVRDRVLKSLEGSFDVTLWTANVFFDIGLKSRLMVSMCARNRRPLTIKGAFGIPRGFFSCPNIDTDSEAIAVLNQMGLGRRCVNRHVPIGVGSAFFSRPCLVSSSSIFRLLFPSTVSGNTLSKRVHHRGPSPTLKSHINRMARRDDLLLLGSRPTRRLLLRGTGSIALLSTRRG